MCLGFVHGDTTQQKGVRRACACETLACEDDGLSTLRKSRAAHDLLQLHDVLNAHATKERPRSASRLLRMKQPRWKSTALRNHQGDGTEDEGGIRSL